MRVVILGASGLVGGQCLHHFSALGWQTRGTHFSYATPETHFFNTLNLADPANAALNLHAFQPQWLVHCGALTHVDHCQTHPDESHLQTVVSTHNVLHLAQQLGARVAYLSTDYVFDGAAGPYAETDEPRPLSVYGQHKLQAEQLVTGHSPLHTVARITTVYGHERRGKNFVARIAAQAASGSDTNLRLPADQYATPINAACVARALAVLMQQPEGGLYHLASTDYMNRVQLAQRVAAHFPQSRLTFTPATTASLGQAAPRPLRGGLRAETFLARFPDFSFTNLDDYLATLPQTPQA